MTRSRQAVLLVEDDTRLGAMVAEYLGRHDLDVTVAPDGERGLTALRRGRFDVVLLDVMLPGIDGLELCRRIRAAPEWVALPVLMLTARGEDVDKIVGLELGADDYLAKPFNPRELLARIGLTHHEFALLAALARAGGRVLSREQLMDALRGTAYEAFDRSIDVHVSKLRAKLEKDPRAPRYIKTVRGVGYALVRPSPAR
jgi:DNA-binding response OmpR family regulator